MHVQVVDKIKITCCYIPYHNHRRYQITEKDLWGAFKIVAKGCQPFSRFLLSNDTLFKVGNRKSNATILTAPDLWDADIIYLAGNFIKLILCAGYFMRWHFFLTIESFSW